MKLLAPNGKPSNLTHEQYKLVRTPEFKAWFGDWENDPENASKVVDENGEPLVVYHGTNELFTEFQFGKSKRLTYSRGDEFYFSNEKDVAKTYGDKVNALFLDIRNPLIVDYEGELFTNFHLSKGQPDLKFKIWTQLFGYHPSVVKSWVNTLNEKGTIRVSLEDRIGLNALVEFAKRNEYNGVIALNVIDVGHRTETEIADDYVIFSPYQIKLADGTNTTFDGSNPDIRFTFGGSVGAKDKDVDGFINSKGVWKFEINDALGKFNYELLIRKCRESLQYSKDIVLFVQDLLPTWIGYDYYPDLRQVQVFILDGLKKDFDEVPFAYDSEFDCIVVNAKNIAIEKGSQSIYSRYQRSEVFREHLRQGATRTIHEAVHTAKTRNRRFFFHELQHAIQYREGWELKSTTPRAILNQLKLLYSVPEMPDDDFKEYVSELEGMAYSSIQYAYYKEVACEKEALLVESRNRLTHIERKKNSPIYKLGGETPNNMDYSKWKRKNVTIRGISGDVGEENNAGAMLGRGLYTAFLSNRKMAKEYGDVYFVVNAIPKNPKVFNTLNEWEIWFYNTLVFKYSKEQGKDFPDKRDFNANTTIEDEMQKLGYDGIIIKGREMVNFKPTNILYFKTENELRNYFDIVISKGFEKGGEVENMTMKDKVAYFAKQFVEQETFYRVIDSGDRDTEITKVDSLDEAKDLLDYVKNDISDKYDIRIIEEYKLSYENDFEDVANNFLENNYFESDDEISYDDVRDYLLDNLDLLDVDENSYTDIDSVFYLKQRDLDKKLSEQTNEYTAQLIRDFSDEFKDFIHYEESAGYMGGSYYATLLMSPDGELVKNDKLLYEVEKSEYEKIDYTGVEKVNLGTRTRRLHKNLDEKNAVIQIRISDHNKVYDSIADAFLSIVIKPEFEFVYPSSQEAYERRGEPYSELPISYKIKTEYKAAYNVEGSILDVSDIREWINDLNYKELIENRDEEFSNGGELSKTPAPKSERIFGSKTNKVGSSESLESAKAIEFSEKTLKSIENKINEHNKKNPDKKITLDAAKAVVRRGMGAYPNTHRPTIKGGKPNSRVAWGLARLNAFIEKAEKGQSKSARYNQDNDLLHELGIKHSKFNDGGYVDRKPIRIDKHGKFIVWENNDYFIAVDDENDARYITLWHKQGDDKSVKVGVLDAWKSKLDKNFIEDYGDYLSIRAIDIDKKHRGRGLGKQMYKELLKWSSDDVKGIFSYLPNRVNKKEIPSIYRYFNSVDKNDYQIIPKKMNSGKFEKGGIIEGKLHSECDVIEGCGEKYDVNGQTIEAERDEAVLVPKVSYSDTVYEITGNPKQIASALNYLSGGMMFEQGAKVKDESGKSIELPKKKEKFTDVYKIDSGSIIINRRSMYDKNRYRVKGTPRQIASAINSINGNGVKIENGAILNDLKSGKVIKMEQGGELKYMTLNDYLLQDPKYSFMESSFERIFDFLKHTMFKAASYKNDPVLSRVVFYGETLDYPKMVVVSTQLNRFLDEHEEEMPFMVNANMGIDKISVYYDADEMYGNGGQVFCPKNKEIECLIFDKSKGFTKVRSVLWCVKRGYKINDVKEDENCVYAYQTKTRKADMFSNVEVADGVKASLVKKSRFRFGGYVSTDNSDIQRVLSELNQGMVGFRVDFMEIEGDTITFGSDEREFLDDADIFRVNQYFKWIKGEGVGTFDYTQKPIIHEDGTFSVGILAD